MEEKREMKSVLDEDLEILSKSNLAFSWEKHFNNWGNRPDRFFVGKDIFVL